MQSIYGWGCLLLGAALVISQIVVSFLEASRAGAVAKQAVAVQGAAQKVINAAESVSSSAETTRNLLNLTGMDSGSNQIESAKTEADAAKREAEAAQEKAEKASGGSQWDFLSTLGGKVPLAVTGAVLILLGAVIMGYVTLSASATASG